jgi:hypothetical protein
LDPADPAAARALVDSADLRMTPRSIQMTESSDERHGTQLSFAMNVPPPLNEAASGDFVQWVNAGTKLLRASGQALAPNAPPRHGPIFTQMWSAYMPWREIQAMTSLLPQDALAEVSVFGFYLDGTTDLGRFNLDPGGALLHEPIAVQARLEGRAFRWKKVADLSIEDGQSVKDDFGQWTIVSSSRMGVILQRKQIALSLSSDQRATKFVDWPNDKFAFVFYHPGRNLACVADGQVNPNANRAATTAFPQYWLQVNFSGPQNGTEWSGLQMRDWDGCRLLIFEKTWLGSAPRDWQSARFTWDDLQGPATPGAASGGESLSNGELERRLAALNRPGPGASRQAVSLYLLDYLRLLDARRFWPRMRPQEPVISGLAALVPEHLDILLDGLPAMSPLCRRAVIVALTEGALESQEPAIIAAVPRAPELAAVLLARGWVGDAHDALFQLLDSPRALPVESLQAIAWFADPQTYPRLLQELESDPNEPLYNALRPLPGIAGPLDATVTRLWRDQSSPMRMLGNLTPALRLALREGKTEALAWACHLAEQLDTNWPYASNGLLPAFEGTVEVPAVPPPMSNQPTNVLAFLRRHHADDFVFDPARQRFVLKQKLNSAADAGSPAPSP